MPGQFNTGYGPAAVVTGAARGIGAGFTSALGDRGFDLLLTDVDEAALQRTSEKLEVRTGRQVRRVALDMREPGAPAELEQFAQASDVGLVVCNHLFPGGELRGLDTDLAQLNQAIDANVRAYVEVAHRFGRHLRDRTSGGLIPMSSMTAAVGSPYVTAYGASKAFVLAFGSGLSYELRSSGVDVLTLVPSSVNTETYRRATQSPSRVFPPMEVDVLVQQGLARLGKRWVAVPGARNLLTAAILTRLLPRRTAISLMGRSMETMLKTR